MASHGACKSINNNIYTTILQVRSQIKTVSCIKYLTVHLNEYCNQTKETNTNSRLMYGIEVWALTYSSKRLEAFEKWYNRWMFRITWAHHNSPTYDHRRRSDEDCQREKMFGHVIPNNTYSIMQGKLISKREPGRRRMS